MQDLTPEARRRLDGIAARHGVSGDAALTLLRALAAGGGAMAQFSHPELGGMGQWSRSGMVMVGDMFNAGLKQRVAALCAELAAMLREGAPFAATGSSLSQSHEQPGTGHGDSAGAWWPAELGAPASSGAQNDVRYAYFPAFRRLAVQQGNRLSLHDTGAQRISGVSQRQGIGGSLIFSTDEGVVRLQDLPLVDGPGRTRPPQAPHPPPGTSAGAPAAERRQPTAPSREAAGGDPLVTIERLAELHARGILTAEEFAAKKAELLDRL